MLHRSTLPPPLPPLTRHDFADGPALTYGFSRNARRGCAPPLLPPLPDGCRRGCRNRGKKKREQRVYIAEDGAEGRGVGQTL